MITIDQVKEDLTSGKASRIYFSPQCLWWTHNDADLEAATAIGKQQQKVNHDTMMRDPEIPLDQKEKIKKMFEHLMTTHQIPLDPSGCPLLQHDSDKALGWITAAENQVQHFGAHGLDAFMKAHHQNCDGKTFKTWAEVNSWIDINNFEQK